MAVHTAGVKHPSSRRIDISSNGFVQRIRSYRIGISAASSTGMDGCMEASSLMLYCNPSMGCRELCECKKHLFVAMPFALAAGQAVCTSPCTDLTGFDLASLFLDHAFGRHGELAACTVQDQQVSRS